VSVSSYAAEVRLSLEGGAVLRILGSESFLFISSFFLFGVGGWEGGEGFGSEAWG
jgi:hypothetical protein